MTNRFTDRERTARRAGLAAAVATAMGASVCCIGPLAAAFLGATSLGALVRFEPLRPYFTVLTLALLALAFYLTYRKRPAEQCEPGSVCDTHGVDRVARLNRIILWIVTIIVIAVLTFPTWSNWILG